MGGVWRAVTRLGSFIGGVGYLISNGLMKRIAASLAQPIESCCSDVQVGTLIQRALGRADGDDICTQPPGDAHVFYASCSPVRPAGFDTTFNMTVLHNLVVDDAMRTMLHTGVGFHYVTPVAVCRAVAARNARHARRPRPASTQRDDAVVERQREGGSLVSCFGGT